MKYDYKYFKKVNDVLELVQAEGTEEMAELVVNLIGNSLNVGVVDVCKITSNKDVVIGAYTDIKDLLISSINRLKNYELVDKYMSLQSESNMSLALTIVETILRVKRLYTTEDKNRVDCKTIKGYDFWYDKDNIYISKDKEICACEDHAGLNLMEIVEIVKAIDGLTGEEVYYIAERIVKDVCLYIYI